jgi:hypothetical protein
MNESIKKILRNYISDISRFDIHSYEMHRGENPEDLYYLLHIKTSKYIVYETDYIGSLANVINETNLLFNNEELTPLRWMVKKDSSIGREDATLCLDAPIRDEAGLKELIIYKSVDSAYRYAVIEVLANNLVSSKHNPHSYGSS